MSEDAPAPTPPKPPLTEYNLGFLTPDEQAVVEKPALQQLIKHGVSQEAVQDYFQALRECSAKRIEEFEKQGKKNLLEAIGGKEEDDLNKFLNRVNSTIGKTNNVSLDNLTPQSAKLLLSILDDKPDEPEKPEDKPKDDPTYADDMKMVYNGQTYGMNSPTTLEDLTAFKKIKVKDNGGNERYLSEISNEARKIIERGLQRMKSTQAQPKVL